MSHATRHQHSWSELMARFAQSLGEPHDGLEVLSFSDGDGPKVVALLLDDGRDLGLVVDLQHPPDPSNLEAFLGANRVENALDLGVYALSPASDTLLFTRRLKDAGAYAYEEWVGELQAFAHAAQAALQALPQALEVDAPSLQDEQVEHAESFRHIWSDFAATQGLGTEPPEPCADGSLLLALEGHWPVFVRPDNLRGCVVLKMAVALIPLRVEGPSAVWPALLRAHTWGEGTHGATFAIDHEEQELVVWRSLPMADLNGFGLNDAIDGLAQVSRHFADELGLTPIATLIQLPHTVSVSSEALMPR